MKPGNEQRLLEIEAAKAQLAWLKAEIATTGEAPVRDGFRVWFALQVDLVNNLQRQLQ